MDRYILILLLFIAGVVIIHMAILQICPLRVINRLTY